MPEKKGGDPMVSMRVALASVVWLVALVSQATAQDTEELAKES